MSGARSPLLSRVTGPTVPQQETILRTGTSVQYAELSGRQKSLNAAMSEDRGCPDRGETRKGLQRP